MPPAATPRPGVAKTARGASGLRSRPGGRLQRVDARVVLPVAWKSPGGPAMSARPFAAAVAFALAAGVVSADDPKKKPATLGEKVVAFCAEHKGKQVGNGQCADLAS